MTETIRKIHKDSGDVYGSPRVHAELVAVHGMTVSPKRVAALMAAAELVVDAITMAATHNQLAGWGDPSLRLCRASR